MVDTRNPMPESMAKSPKEARAIRDAKTQPGHACSGREGPNLAGESPAVSIARFRHVAIPQFVLGNHTSIAWCIRPGCPEAVELLR
jgi:hypothetical protein